MTRPTRLLVALALLCVPLAAVPTASADAGCEGTVSPYDRGEATARLRIEVDNRAAPTNLDLCVIQASQGRARAEHEALMPPADVYVHTFWLPRDRFTVSLRVSDPTELTTSRAGVTADLTKCALLVWRPEVTFAPGIMIFDSGTMTCGDPSPSGKEEVEAMAPAPNSGRLVPLEWTPMSAAVVEDSRIDAWVWGLLAVPLLAWPFLRPAVWLLFTRLLRPDLLEQKHRARISELVQADPGIHLEEIGRRLELANGAVRHHVGILVHNKLLVELRRHGKRCFFAPGSAPRDRLEALATLSMAPARRVYDAVREDALGVADIAQRARLSARQARRWLKELVVVGLVSRDVATGRARFVARATSLS